MMKFMLMTSCTPEICTLSEKGSIRYLFGCYPKPWSGRARLLRVLKRQKVLLGNIINGPTK
jgi:hypothetical protein